MSTERALDLAATDPAADQVVLLTSRLLRARGVRHAFSTRRGGVSAPPFDTLNTARRVGDAAEAVRINVTRLLTAAGLESTKLFTVSQVHGASVRDIGPTDDPEAVAVEEADALCSSEPGTTLGIRTADCVPVLLHDASTGAVAAAHAGWRGVAGNVVGAALAALMRVGGSPARVAAAIGPCIGPCCFEVGPEVVEAIEDAVPVPDPALVRRDTPRPHLDLRLAIRHQLRAMGVQDADIEDVPGCTRCRPDVFFSFRRDGAKSGRMLAIVAPSVQPIP